MQDTCPNGYYIFNRTANFYTYRISASVKPEGRTRKRSLNLASQTGLGGRCYQGSGFARSNLTSERRTRDHRYSSGKPWRQNPGNYFRHS